MITVVVVDDDPLVGRAVRDMLVPEADIEVVAVARDGVEALEVVTRLRPEVVLMDLQMPGMDGIEVTRRLRTAAPDSRVLVLAVHSGDEHVRGALEAGALGFVVKGDPPELLGAAIRLVAAGGALLGPPTGRALAAFAAPLLGAAMRARLATLTARERDVLVCIARGQSNAQVASELYIGSETVKHYVTQILRKLGCNRVQAATLATQAGLNSERPTGGHPPNR